MITKRTTWITLLFVALVITITACSTNNTGSKNTLEELPEEWKVIKKYAIENQNISPEYFDEHYEYVRKEIKRPGPDEYTQVTYNFNIIDSQGNIQSVEFKKALEGLEIIPPFYRGFPSEELDVIISESEALEFAKQSGLCEDFINESKIKLTWAGTSKFEFAWDWINVNDGERCFIDAETGLVEYERLSQHLI